MPKLWWQFTLASAKSFTISEHNHSLRVQSKTRAPTVSVKAARRKVVQHFINISAAKLHVNPSNQLQKYATTHTLSITPTKPDHAPR